MRRRRNRATSAAQARYQRTHWGAPATRTFVVRDPMLPDELVQMGRLEELLIKPRGRGRITLDGFGSWRGDHYTSNCHVTHDEPDFDRTGCPERLYLVIEPKHMRRMRSFLWVPGGQTYWLQDVADHVGGTQAEWDHDKVKVQPLGPCENIVYCTKKIGDDAELVDGEVVGPGSSYTHAHGEDSGLFPWLCIDNDGRLWYAGGNYRVHDDGIVD